jgi:soluble lytic murein transglycosylase
MRCTRRFFAVLLLLSSPVLAQSPQDIFSAAQQAYKKQDARALDQYAANLQAQNYVLVPYVDYWSMLLKLETAEPATVRDFLVRYAELPFADTVRAEWLKKLGKRQEWPLFFEELPNLSIENAAVSCLAILGRAEKGQATALVEGRSLWLRGNSQPAECDVLYARMVEQGILTSEDIWKRTHLALESGQVSVAKATLLRLPSFPPESAKFFDEAYENPQRVLEKKKFTSATRLGRELNLYALERVSRSQPELALEFWQNMKAEYSLDEQRALWARMAVHAARRHDARALEWYAYAEDAPLSEEQSVWKARAALRARQWGVLLTALAAMPQALQEEGSWRYWKARALKEQGQLGAANAVLLPLAQERNFYGLLAEEELGASMSAPPPPAYKASEAEVQAVAQQAGIRRALEFHRLGMRWEGRREWKQATRAFNDRQLLAAAELAFREQMYDVAINTADQTVLTHDFSLRYPTPYRDLMRNYAREQALDEAWVYGLIRQESRFTTQAKSSAGASGLMQVMPATAKWIAKRIGLSDYRDHMIYQVDTNIRFGTHYLRYSLDRAEGQSLVATAGYNAGPGRAKRWLPPQAMEGAIYAETIPFSETRDYVQKVMSNAVFYAQQLGMRMQPIKERLGMVAASTTPENNEKLTEQ